MKCNNRGMKED